VVEEEDPLVEGYLPVLLKEVEEVGEEIVHQWDLEVAEVVENLLLEEEVRGDCVTLTYLSSLGRGPTGAPPGLNSTSR
jgi:hypothetical protein